jgi:hypothetical protein
VAASEAVQLKAIVSEVEELVARWCQRGEPFSAKSSISMAGMNLLP